MNHLCSFYKVKNKVPNRSDMHMHESCCPDAERAFSAICKISSGLLVPRMRHMFLDSYLKTKTNMGPAVMDMDNRFHDIID